MKDLKTLLKKENVKSPLVEIVQLLFNSRDVIHLAHLKTTSYAQHVALGDYYDGILDFADTLVETEQGVCGKLLDLNIPAATVQEPITHLKGIKEMLCSKRDSLEYEFQKNIIDEATALVAKTLYKLQFLK